MLVTYDDMVDHIIDEYSWRIQGNLANNEFKFKKVHEDTKSVEYERLDYNLVINWKKNTVQVWDNYSAQFSTLDGSYTLMEFYTHLTESGGKYALHMMKGELRREMQRREENAKEEKRQKAITAAIATNLNEPLRFAYFMIDRHDEEPVLIVTSNDSVFKGADYLFTDRVLGDFNTLVVIPVYAANDEDAFTIANDEDWFEENAHRCIHFERNTMRAPSVFTWTVIGYDDDTWEYAKRMSAKEDKWFAGHWMCEDWYFDAEHELTMQLSEEDYEKYLAGEIDFRFNDPVPSLMAQYG